MERPQARSLGLLWLRKPRQVTFFSKLSVPVSQHCDKSTRSWQGVSGPRSHCPIGHQEEVVVLVETDMCFY